MCTLILYNLPACQQPLLIQTQYVTHSRGPIFLSVFYTLNELLRRVHTKKDSYISVHTIMPE